MCIYVYTYTMCVLGRDQMKVVDPREMELWMVVNYHVGAESQAQVLLV